jgi:glutamate dehydrogenase
MPLREEERKQAVVERLAELAAPTVSKAGAAAFGCLVRAFYAHVPPADLLARDERDLLGAARSLWDFAALRRPGEAILRILGPGPDSHGWVPPRATIEIVNDDMPFLVDSVTAALNAMNLTVDLVIHPIVRVLRDGDGRLLDLPDDAAAGDVEGDRPDERRESLMQVEIAAPGARLRRHVIATRLAAVLADVRLAVEDFSAMRRQVETTIGELERGPVPMPAGEVAEAAAFLRWLDRDNFTFLGYREYRYGSRSPDAPVVRPDVGLGLLRDDDYSVFGGLRHFAVLPRDVRDYLTRKRLLTVSKSNRRSTVHRPAHMDAVGVQIFAADGTVEGERLFLGLLTSAAYSATPATVPILRVKIRRVMERAGFSPGSHDAKALQHILDSFPRDELFQVDEAELYDTAIGILNLQERQRIALFLRRDPLERFVSAFVYLPRERYSPELRRRMTAILEEAWGGRVVGFHPQLDDGALGRLHFTIETTRGQVPEIVHAALEARLAEAGRLWSDRLEDALVAAHGEERGMELLQRYADAFPISYREARPVEDAVADIAPLETVRNGAPLGMRLYERVAPGALGFTIVHAETPVPLSDVLPMLENMGLKVIGEVPHEIAGTAGGPRMWLQDFELLVRDIAGPDVPVASVAARRQRFEEAFARIWLGEVENDGFNRLVLSAGLDWRQIVILRLYSRFLRQAGIAFSLAYMEEAVVRHPALAARLVALFESRFDPASRAGADLRAIALTQEIDHLLDSVTSLDDDRILRSFLLLINKTLRTNYYQRLSSGEPKPYVSVKLASEQLDFLPLPRPLVEIFVYSPRVEAIHLRGGRVARGGIRWSDRREDFRIEILGLMKAQMVKNAVIVPVGSKGGFVVKRPLPAASPRDVVQAEGIECYKTFMRGLLDLTDNIVGTEVVPPPDVVRHDHDDPYLVVAADKGTATFSDIANSVAAEYGFWLGDAFASGGSAGYDHKAMGITARGAWELVKRHFRELGRDIQRSDFTVVGVGDMAGDVFGNGMMLSPHIRLVAAFNHQHIFLDPSPDAAASFAERRRLFAMPRSSWADYDKSLISQGGGVFERSLKAIPLTPQVKALLGIEANSATPADLIRAILRAPVDLLWFGGIGTYVKASEESHADVGDRANDALRIDAKEIAASVVGEGANLAVTQRGRIEYALKGGRINTDAIDNSAGVDTSDHEVNLKILLDAVVATGELDVAGRNAELASVTDEVAALVLRDNYLQGQALSLAETQGVDVLDQQIRLMRRLERSGKLARGVEFLPDDETLASRAAARLGLTRPELAVLLAYAKTTLYAELLESELPDDPALAGDLLLYFPKRFAERYRPAIEQHRLRREIIATFVANSIVNRAGISFVGDLAEKTGRAAGDIALAYAITREIFALRPSWEAIEALDGVAPAAQQYEMLLAIQRLIERVTSWFLQSGLALDLRARVAEFGGDIAALTENLTKVLPPANSAVLASRTADLVNRGAPAALAERIAGLDFLVAAVDIVRLAQSAQHDLLATARIYFALGVRLSFDALRAAATQLRPETAWQKMAIAALVDDFYQLQSELTRQIIETGPTASVDAFLANQAAALAPLDALLQEIVSASRPDLAMLTVANRQLRALASA